MTGKELARCGIQPICYPPYSPDLSPIETVRDEMKDWLDEHYPFDHRLSYTRLRQAVQQTWNSIGSGRLHRFFLAEMHDRCWAVIEAEGRDTCY